MRKLSFLICLLVASFAAWATGVPYQNSLGNPEVINNSSAVNFDLNDGDDDEEPDDWGDEEPDDPDDPFEDEPDICIYVDYNPEQGYVSGDECYYYGETVTLTAEPNLGCTFVEWQDWYGESLGSELTYTFQLTGDDYSDFFYAIFEGEGGDGPDETDYYINVNYNSAMGDVEGYGGYNEDDVVTLQAYPKSGCRFGGWTDSEGTVVSTSNPWIFSAGEDMDINAVFEVNTNANCTLSLSYDVNEGSVTVLANGAEVMLTGNDEFPSGTDVTLTATPANGYFFVNWSDGFPGFSHTLTLYENVELTANFNAIQTVTTGTNSNLVASGRRVNCKFEPEVGGYYTFISTSSNFDHDGYDAFGILYDASMNLLAKNDDVEDEEFTEEYGDSQFRMQYTLDDSPIYLFAGRTYYIAAGSYRDYEVTNYSEGIVGTTTLIIEGPDESSETHTVTINYDPNEGTVKFNGNVISGEEELPAGEVTLIAYPAGTYEFAGWEDEEENVLSTEESYTFNLESDIELSAYFEEEGGDDEFFSVTVDYDDEMGSVEGDGEHASGSRVTLYAYPEEGYKFVKWEDNNGYELSTNTSYTFTLNGNILFYAVFAVDEGGDDEEYTVTVYYDPEKGTVEYDDEVVDDEEGIVIPAGEVTFIATPEGDYQFAGWTDGDENVLSTDASYTFTLSDNIELHAVFEEGGDEEYFSISVSSNNDEWGYVDGGEGEFTNNESVTLTAYAYDGYKFDKWEDESTTNPRNIRAREGVEYVAYFAELETYTVTVNYNDLGTVECNDEVVSGDVELTEGEVTLIAYPEEGNSFVGWTDSEGNVLWTEDSYTFVLSDDFEINAVFVPEYTVNVYYNSSMGSAEGSGLYASGTEVTLTANPASGFRFVAWKEGDGTVLSNSNPWSFTIEDDLDVYATFEVITYTISVTYDSEMGSVSGAGTYTNGAEVTLTATPADGHFFVQWSDGYPVYSRTFTVDDDAEYKAEFHEIQTVTRGRNSNLVASGRRVNCKFVPEVDGLYTFESTESNFGSDGTDAYGILYDDLMNELVSNDDDGDGNEFYFSYNLTAGETYYISAGSYNDYNEGNYGNNVGTTTLVIDGPHLVTTLVNDDDYGYVVGDGYYNDGATATLWAYSYDDYEFLRWSDGSNANPHYVTITSDTTFTAIFRYYWDDVYTIDAYSNNENWGTVTGLSDYVSTQYLYGEKVTLRAVPANDYCHFVQWGDGVTANPRIFNVEESGEYEAIFESDEFTITVSSEHATVSGGGTYYYGDEFTITAEPDEGWFFAYWDFNDGSAFSYANINSASVTGDIDAVAVCREIQEVEIGYNEVYATYRNINCVFRPEVSDTYTFVSDGYGDYMYGCLLDADMNPLVEKWNNYGYDFKISYDLEAGQTYYIIAGFYNSGNSGRIGLTVSAPITITATSANEEHGYVEGGGTYNYGDYVELEATAADDYEFFRWSNGETENPLGFTAVEDGEYVAFFKPYGANTYYVNANPNIGGWGSVEGSGQYVENDVATLTAKPIPNYHLVQWSDGDKTNPREVIVTDNIELQAEFAVDTFNVSIVAEHGQVVSGEGEYAWNDEAYIEVVADEGYHFLYWADDNTTSRTRYYRVQGDVTLTAVFEPNYYDIHTYAANGTVNGGGNYAYGTEVTLTAVPATGYHFTGWNDGESNAQRKVTVTGESHVTAYFDINTYTVTVETEHGTVEDVSPDPYIHGTSVSFKAVPDANYKFVRWNATNTTNPLVTTVTSNMVLRPVFIPENESVYTLTVKAGEGGSATGSGTFVANEKTIISATANAGYHFVQWSDENTDAQREVTVKANKTYTAEFEINTYDVTVLAGANGTATGSGKFEHGSSVKLTATANAGYHFVRWSDGNNSAERTITVNKDVELTAEFEINQYTVKASATNGSVEGTGKYDHGTEATLTATAANGYHFTQWSDGVKTETRKATVTSDLEFTAEFAINTYTIKVTAANGTATGAGTYEYNSRATISVTPAEGYQFTQWSDGAAMNPRTIVVANDLEFVAEFEIITYTVRVLGSNGTVTGAGTYNYGAEATISATANTGYHFVKWDDGVETATRKETVKSNLSLSAVFAANTYTISVDSAANGTITGAGTYAYGESATLKATANKGYHFVMWTDSLKTASRTVEVTKNAMFAAEFAANTYELTLKGKNGKVEGAGTYEYGAEATLTATANAGYHFVKWSDGETANPRKVTITENKTYTAKFAADSYVVKLNGNFGNITASSNTLEFGATITLTAIPDEGYHFVKWSDENTENPRTVTLTAEMLKQVTASGFEFTAIFEKDEEEISGTAVADEAAEAVNIFAYGNTVVVENATNYIYVYNAMGSLISRVAPEAGRTEIQVNGTGVYVVKTGSAAKRVMIND
jgi:hypothetical protein